ncbi:hypothetical protein RJ55_01240 [Drechmeria coniospora]|nr:hypothetical protein RJ55_01240 [Drechmeria coniospora]
MPPPVPSTLSPVHLYRHLLREVSYLPPAFRPAISSVIQARFHRHGTVDKRAKAHLVRARNVLRTLRAANSGDKAAMGGLMARAFGRSGRRRRDLLLRFAKFQGPGDWGALEALLDKTPACRDASTTSTTPTRPSDEPRAPGKRRHLFLEKWDLEKLTQFLHSQKQQQGRTKSTTSWLGSVKSTDQNQLVPERNIWGKPPVESLVRTKRAKWWKRTVDKMMPPLGRGEWDLLARLSDGAQEEREWAIPERRQPATPLSPSGTKSSSASFHWEPWARQPAAVVERENSLPRQLRSGGRALGPYGGKKHKTLVSSRWFQRAYNRIWQLSPITSQDPNTLRYSFQWGAVQSKLPRPTKAQLDIFQGVDARGRKIDGTS